MIAGRQSVMTFCILGELQVIHKNIAASVIVGLLLAIAISVIRGGYDLYASKQGMKFANNEPFGGDYIAFYTGGTLFRNSPESLYDLSFQKAFQEQHFQGSYKDGAEPFLPFVYPPLVAFLFSFFALYPFEVSFYLWIAISFLLALLSVELILRTSEYKTLSRWFVYLLLLSFTPFSITNISGGQLASVGLLCMSVTYYFFMKQRHFLAGIALIFAYYKPPLFLLFFIALSLKSERYFLGAISAVFIGFILSLLCIGFEQHLKYMAVVLSYLQGDVALLDFNLPVSLNVGLLAPILTGNISNISIIGITTLILLALIRIFGQRSQSLDFALLSATSVLLSVQVNEYDLTLLLPSLFLLLKGAFFTGNTKRVDTRCV